MQRKKRVAIILILLLLIFGTAFFVLHSRYTINTSYIRQGETRIKTHKPEIRLWDDSIEDGDTVTVYLDGKPIFKNLGLEYTPAVYKSGSLSSGLHEISIEAIDEGTYKPASPRLSIKDTDTTLAFDMKSWKDSARSSWIINIE